MTENEFYTLNTKVEALKSDTLNGWFPSVAELEEYNQGKRLERNPFLTLVIFFAGNPYKENKTAEYLACVNYCKKITLNIPLEKDIEYEVEGDNDF